MAEAARATLTVGLIDAGLLSRECLTRALEGLHARLAVVAFASIEHCVEAARGDLDLVIYRAPADDRADGYSTQPTRAACAAFDIPVIVLSDAAEAQQVHTIRAALKCGARGFIPARTTSLSMMLAALRFVSAGGTFAPLDFLLGDDGADPQPTSVLPPPGPMHRFTGRQSAVLGLLRQGKANKIIADTLGMSESTVKVHVRNIMRTTGAANRTEVAYRLQDARGWLAGAGTAGR